MNFLPFQNLKSQPRDQALLTRASRWVFGRGIVLLAISCWSQPAFGLQWINTTNGFYDVPGNWNGGTVPGDTDLALFNNAAGSLILWDDGVGDTEAGELRIENGNFVFTGCCGAAGIPFTHTANGRVNIQNGSSLVLGNQSDEPINLTSTDNLDVFTSGTLTVRFGSVVTAPRNGIGFDAETGNTATLNVAGSGAEFNVADFGFIGNLNSNGVLNITDGGSVTYGGNVQITNSGSSINRDEFSSFDIADGMTLTVRDDAQVNFTGGTSIRDDVTYRFESGADFSATDFFNVGLNGTLIVDGVDTTFTTNTAGGAINQWGAFNNPGAAAMVTNGGELNLNQFTSLGFSPTEASDFTLDVFSGGTVNSQTLEIGRGAVGVGVLNIDGAGSNVTQAGSSSLTVGSTASGATGSGSVTVSNGGTFNSGSGSSTFEGTGRLNITNGGNFVANGDFSSSAGTLNHVQGTLIVDGGTFDPGTTHPTGNGTASAATLILRNGANANLSGTLGIRANDTVRVESGASFDVVNDHQIFSNVSRSFAVVEGAGSVLSAQRNLSVGFSTENSGRLTILNGGLVRSDNFCCVGELGELSGNGTLQATDMPVVNDGLIDPNDTEAFFAIAFGTLNIDGDFVQTSTGDYAADLNDTENDLLVVSGSATLGGELSLFGASDLYVTTEVLTGLNVFGTFDSLSGVASFGGEANAVTYDADSVNVTRAFEGDVNVDGNVDVLNDAFALVGNLGTTDGAIWEDGDFNADGAVDVLNDAFALVVNLGRSFVE